MALKLKEIEPSLDYFEVMEIVEANLGVDVDDYAGMFSKENSERKDAHRKQWMIDNGYVNVDHVLTSPNPGDYKNDWPKDSPEMVLRIEINTKYREAEKELEKDEPPYLNFWHQHCDYINRGGVNVFHLGGEDDEVVENDHDDDGKEIPEKYKNWIQEIHNAIREVVKDSPAYDAEEDTVNLYIDW